MAETIEVFSDLTLYVPAEARGKAVDALTEAASEPWSFDAKRSEELLRNAGGDRSILVFRRDESDDEPAASLSIWSNADGFYVPNVVPTSVAELTHAQYNAILADFAKRIVEPVARNAGYRVKLTPPRQSLTDWVPEDVARKLSAFSRLANKSTGASHPLDQERWFAFIIAAHRSHVEFGVDRLARWLHEVERWDEDSAHHLAGDYELALSLLDYAAKH